MRPRTGRTSRKAIPSLASRSCGLRSATATADVRRWPTDAEVSDGRPNRRATKKRPCHKDSELASAVSGNVALCTIGEWMTVSQHVQRLRGATRRHRRQRCSGTGPEATDRRSRVSAKMRSGSSWSARRTVRARSGANGPARTQRRQLLAGREIPCFHSLMLPRPCARSVLGRRVGGKAAKTSLEAALGAGRDLPPCSTKRGGAVGPIEARLRSRARDPLAPPGCPKPVGAETRPQSTMRAGANRAVRRPPTPDH